MMMQRKNRFLLTIHNFWNNLWKLPFSHYIEHIKNPHMRHFVQTLHIFFICFIVVLMFFLLIQPYWASKYPQSWYQAQIKNTLPTTSHHQAVVTWYDVHHQQYVIYSFVKSDTLYLQQDQKQQSNLIIKKTEPVHSLTKKQIKAHQVPLWIKTQINQDTILIKQLKNKYPNLKFHMNHNPQNVQYCLNGQTPQLIIGEKSHKKIFNIYLQGIDVSKIVNTQDKQTFTVQKNIFFNDRTSQNYLKRKHKQANQYQVFDYQVNTNNQTILFFALNKNGKIERFRNAGSLDIN